MGYRSIVPNININTESGQLRTELSNTFFRLDSQLSTAPYKLYSFNGPAGNAGVAETNLTTYTVDYGTLSKQGSSLIIFASGKTAANANNKTFKLYFGSTVIFTTGAIAANNISWTVQAEIIRNGAAAQLTWVEWTGSATLTSTCTVSTATESLANGVVLKCTGTGAASDDISLYTLRVLLST